MDYSLQDLINNGMAWRLEGAVGRAAMGAIDAGHCVLGETGHHDFYGNYVPSRSEVESGTKGSIGYAERVHNGRFGCGYCDADDGPRCDDPGAHSPACTCDGGEFIP